MTSPVFSALARLVERQIGGRAGRIIAALLAGATVLWLTYTVNTARRQRWFDL